MEGQMDDVGAPGAKEGVEDGCGWGEGLRRPGDERGELR